MRPRITVPCALAVVLAACGDPTTLVGTAASASATFDHGSAPTVHRLVTGLQRGRGSAVGPGGALYVAEAAAGRISRVDPENGTVTTFASGLPISPSPAGGVVDVAFRGGTAYALVTLVGPEVGGTSVDGIYRVDGPNHTVFADLGAFSMAHPPSGFPWAVANGVQFALEPFRDGFLVTDGHHNRVLQVSHDGEVSELIAFGNIVPTGLAVSGNTIYMAEAGPIPHLAQDGKVVTFSPGSTTATTIAAGAPLLVDVEFGRGRTLFALSQGTGSGGPPATPATPNTGSLVRVNADGTLTVITSPLDRPTSLKFIGNTAYIVTLPGDIWKIDNVAGPPFGNED
ncbi:MAG: ScyD/ScyE family protein [Gemmatimonadota bacterium]|nr:ScyD/ScyE family protein [Gemmatimonadota bacterium]